MWGVAGDRLGGDGSIVVRVFWVSQTVVTANGAALRPPETRLTCSTLLSGRTKVAGTIVGAGAGRRQSCSILEAIKNAVKCIAACRDSAIKKRL